MDSESETGKTSHEIDRLLGLVSAGAMSQAIAVAAELGLADVMASGPCSAAELASATHCHPPSLHRLLRALASADVCIEREDGRFELTTAGSLLRSAPDGGFRSYMMWWGKHRWGVWANLLHSVRTGEPAGALSGNSIGMMELDRDAVAAAVFHGAMADVSRTVAAGLIRACAPRKISRLVDVGGGHGELLAALLTAHPHMQGVLFDQPHAAEGARRNFARAGLDHRCQVVCGDFFHSLPSGADGLLLKSILHDWNDERAAIILRNCRKALEPGGRLLIVEQILPERFTSVHQQHGAVQDLNMLVMLGGRERTERQFHHLLHASEFAVMAIGLAALNYSVIDAIAV